MTNPHTARAGSDESAAPFEVQHHVERSDVEGPPIIDPRALAASSTVEDLAAKADELVLSMEDPTALLAKPCSSLVEAPELLSCFGMLLGGLAPLPGMVVLDFGAGSCWTSHFLCQLGCQVIAMDVSEAMLDLGKRRFQQQPLFGERPVPSFVVFDGRHMEIADASVDRILCFDALHHVPNTGEVISEMGRVLRAGGIAGFSEPGPLHSRQAQSQHEMRRYGVPEFDLVIEDIWAEAVQAGFDELSVGIFTPAPNWVTLEEFASFVRPVASDPASTKNGVEASDHSTATAFARMQSRLLRSHRLGSSHSVFAAALRRSLRLTGELGDPPKARASFAYLSHVRGVLQNRRMFLLRKPGQEVTDSREATGLAAQVRVENLRVSHGSDDVQVSGVCHIQNTGRNRWLPSSAGQGAVLLGLRLGREGHPAADHGRVALPGDVPVDPGSVVTVHFETRVRAPGADEGPLRLEIDLVSEGITWFANVHGAPYEVRIEPLSERP
jgi:SAM-dependent methyltransferase